MGQHNSSYSVIQTSYNEDSTDFSRFLELELWKEIASKRLSPSHDRWHVDRVLEFAQQLCSIYGGDMQVITAAVILHDLGRQDPTMRGQASAENSVEQAKNILPRVKFPAEKIEQVLIAIAEHDQPELRPSTLEGRILKDADFLAGFGAWGILRTAMWAGETRDGVPQIIDRLRNRMPKRFAHLEFQESRRFAWHEILFAKHFVSRLEEPFDIEAKGYPGKYIILEGISGSGKDTQALLLQKRLEQDGKRVVMVVEPSDTFRTFRKSLGESTDPVVTLFLLMADRYKLIQKTVIPSLQSGIVVLSVRSFLSTLVYQENEMYDSMFLALAHQFVPAPDLVILYDIDPDIAFKRIQKRDRQLSSDEVPEKMLRYRQKYLEICGIIPSIMLKIVNAEANPEEVSSETWRVVREAGLAGKTQSNST